MDDGYCVRCRRWAAGVRDGKLVPDPPQGQSPGELTCYGLVWQPGSCSQYGMKCLVVGVYAGEETRESVDVWVGTNSVKPHRVQIQQIDST